MSALPKREVVVFPRLAQTDPEGDANAVREQFEVQVTELLQEFRELLKKEELTKQKLYEELVDARNEIDELRQRLDQIEARAADLEPCDVECEVGAIGEGGRALCSVRVHGMWVPVTFDERLLRSHGLIPGMRFNWRITSTERVCEDDISPYPVPQLPADERSEYDRLYQRFLERHPKDDED